MFAYSLPVTLVLLAACAGHEPAAAPDSLADQDHDGYTADLDCDDANAAVHPDAPEACDGVDNDCTGAVDDGRTEWLGTLEGDDLDDACAASCTLHVLGSLRITGDRTELPDLSCITDVDGELEIADMPDLTSLHGLESLQDVGGSATIHDLPSLTSLDGLSGLHSVRDNLTIVRVAGTSSAAFAALTRLNGELDIEATELTDLDGLAALTGAAQLTIRDNPLLRSIQGLGNASIGVVDIERNDVLESLAGLEGVRTAAPIQVVDNPSLTALTTFPLLSRATGLTVQGSPALRSLAGLEALTSVNGDVTLTGLGIPSLSGLDNLLTVEGSVTLTDLDLTSLEGLGSLETAEGALHLEALPRLRDLHGLDRLTRVARLEIHGADGGPSSLEGLEALTTVPESVEIVDLGQLTSLAGLDSLTDVGGNLTLRGDVRLASVAGLNPAMVVRSSVLLDNLPNLPSLVGLPALTSTGGLRVHATGVTTLAGLEALERIDTSLTIDANPALTSLLGLDSLSRIDGDLVITANPLLVDLAGEALTVVGGGVQIRGNESLGDDTANAWLEHLTVVRGAVDIGDNGP